jgi:hypothetical protein
LTSSFVLRPGRTDPLTVRGAGASRRAGALGCG